LTVARPDEGAVRRLIGTRMTCHSTHLRSFYMNDSTTALPPFHLAFPVHSIAAARKFYGDLLGCPEGRSAEDWVDFNFYGHQIVAHLAPDEIGHRKTSAVDGDAVPVRHFGVVLSMDQWQAAAKKLSAAGLQFIIEPHIRFKGEVGEQATMFFLDPSGNALEMKAFANIASLFAK
jgi:extradiol dioxygenase family protein